MQISLYNHQKSRGEKRLTLWSKKYTENRIIWKSKQQPLIKVSKLVIDELSVPKTFPNIQKPLDFNNEDKLAFLQLSLGDDCSLLEAETLQAVG